MCVRLLLVVLLGGCASPDVCLRKKLEFQWHFGGGVIHHEPCKSKEVFDKLLKEVS